MNLQNSQLLRQQAYIGGAWCDADNRATITVRNPFDASPLGTVPNLGQAETARAIAAADAALPAWRAKTGKERGAVLRRWHALIEANSDDLALLLTLEQGKPLAEARGELNYALSFVEWFAEEAKRVYGDVLPHTRSDQRMLAIRQPVGVCAAIIAWNFPSALVTRKVSPALAAGCTVVLKPSELTPFTALALAWLGEQAGIPPGVLNVVIGDPAPIGTELTQNPTVRKLTFTGSTQTGRLLMQQSASNIKKLSLELGGNAPFIVFEDADLDEAVQGLVLSKFRNAGQTCVCANRVYVHASVADAFNQKLLAEIRRMKVGGGLEDGVTQGPLIDQRAVDKVTRLVADATAHGATLLAGGKLRQAGTLLYEPTLLTGITDAMELAHEEIFGPVVGISTFDSEAAVLARANDSASGLAAYFYTANLERVWRMMEGLEYGIVGVNTGAVSNEVGPFGGIKESGVGREGSKYGIEEFLEIKYVCLAGKSFNAPH
ncbi:NAD-dependent succinate-semialdehyde dehydrogenase [Achromobacter marplatensis]|uniref:NAD-dependent succinate-semialdehyde dehydrogenase n=1 Tax=Achromobacter marplatensis TaxID=470868 RepID=A0AA42WGI1_9BURK|nr:NAD-dependent succinate-semialdehyde dehydrogenase [Achromobacter marplatensis]MDH2053851.1 NAD-dependent succinate-semialdehyde dehydrogenase [Achromobacter marplatensis]